jgi:hypothetical protein
MQNTSTLFSLQWPLASATAVRSTGVRGGGAPGCLPCACARIATVKRESKRDRWWAFWGGLGQTPSISVMCLTDSFPTASHMANDPVHCGGAAGRSTGRDDTNCSSCPYDGCVRQSERETSGGRGSAHMLSATEISVCGRGRVIALASLSLSLSQSCNCAGPFDRGGRKCVSRREGFRRKGHSVPWGRSVELKTFDTRLCLSSIGWQFWRWLTAIVGIDRPTRPCASRHTRTLSQPAHARMPLALWRAGLPLWLVFPRRFETDGLRRVWDIVSASSHFTDLVLLPCASDAHGMGGDELLGPQSPCSKTKTQAYTPCALARIPTRCLGVFTGTIVSSITP